MDNSGKWRDLAVTAMGAVTSLGHDVVNSVAAMRAGLLNLHVSSDLSSGGEEELSVSVHQVPLLTDGFFQVGAWVTMAVHALRDLKNRGRTGQFEGAFFNGAAVIGAVPEITSERIGWEEDNVEAELLEYFLKPVLALAGLGTGGNLLSITREGHTGTARAFDRAQNLFSTAAAKKVLVIAADSYIDTGSFEYLAENGRLKSSENPFGLMPGEASVALLLEPLPAPGSPSLQYVEAVIEGNVTASIGSRDVQAVSRGLASAMTDLLGRAGRQGPFVGTLYVDINGEPWKSEVWGLTETLLLDHVAFDQCRVVVPAESFGETGSASGALAVACAAQSFTRGYAHGRQALICSISDSGDVGVTMLRKP